MVYWLGDDSYSASTRIYVKRLDRPASADVEIAPNFYDKRFPIWSPSGEIVFYGVSKDDEQPSDWWLSSPHGGAPRCLGANAVLVKAGITLGGPGSWVGNNIYFSNGYTNRNLWSVSVDPQTARITGTPRRLSISSATDEHPSASLQARLAYSSEQEYVNVWDIPLTGNTGGNVGEPRQLTRTASKDIYPSVSDNLETLVFASERGSRTVKRRNLRTGAEEELASTQSDYDSPLVSPDGSRVAIAFQDPNPKWVIKLLSLSRQASTVTFPNAGPPRSFSHDGKLILYEAKDCSSACIGALDTTIGKTMRVAEKPDRGLASPMFSPNDHWIAFQSRIPGRSAQRQIFIAPFGHDVRPDQWIPVTTGEHTDREPRWSPNGRLLYFLTERDGFRCIMAQRLTPEMRPAGQPFFVKHFHSSRRTLKSVRNAGQIGLTILKDRMVLSIAERTGEIWVLSRWNENQR